MCHIGSVRAVLFYSYFRHMTCVCLCAFVLSSSAKFLTAVQFNSEKFKSHWINMRSYFQSYYI